ncbi:MAG TPA: hypothetical protein VF817_04140 [Patescibacteria group bacterium]
MKIKKIIIIIFGAINSCVLPVSALFALMSPMAFDAPGSEKNPAVWIFFVSVITYPLVGTLSLIFTIISYKKQEYDKALIVSLIPMIFLIIAVLIN